ncbi:MAG: lysozyme inhibitor LprI family protein [Pseudomonadota bacterium]
MEKLLVAAAFVSGLWLATQAEAQSFKCSAAAISAEFEICNNEDLIVSDERLAAKYRQTLRNVVGENASATLKQSQFAWLKKRNQCKLDAACLEDIYRDRLTELDAIEKRGYRLARVVQ